MSELSRHGQASEAEMRAFARGDAQRIFSRSVAEWDGMDHAFFHTAQPYALDEALSVALEMGHREGVGAIAVAAHIAGSSISRPGSYQDLAAASEYAAIGQRISVEYQR